MKRYILLLAAVAYSLSALEIEETRTFSKYVEPELMQSGFSIQKQASNINTIQNSFSKISKKIQAYDICKGGKYRIRPVYLYKKNEKVFNGYSGHIDFKCIFKDTKKFDRVLNALEINDEKLTLNTISWHIDENIVEQIKESLKDDSLKYSIKRALQLEKSLQSYKCTPKKIKFESIRAIAPYRGTAVASSSIKSESVAPIKEERKITLNVEYLFECIK